ncbi:MAG: DUF1376 domain-containing protein [Rhizobiaceae bacterium]
MSDLPEPLTPPDCDVRSLEGFDLNVERLMSSELVALATGEEFKAAIMLWCRSWKQVPAASLPDDDRILASFAGLSLMKWRKVRAMALRGFVKCLDGRLYHPVLAVLAIKGAENRRRFLAKREMDAERLREWRSSQKGNVKETSSETSSETRFVASVPVLVPVPKKEPLTPSPSSEPERAAAPPSPVRDKSDRERLAALVATAIGVQKIGDLPPNLAGNLMAEVDSMLAQNCDFTADIATALAIRPDGKWPGNPRYWTKAALGNRDRRLANPAAAGHGKAANLHRSERDKRLRSWLKTGQWAASWGPQPGEPGCCLTADEISEAQSRGAA